MSSPSTNDSNPSRERSHRHVFQATNDRRWRRSRFVMISVGLVVLALLVILVGTMLSDSALRHVRAGRILNSAEASKYIEKNRYIDRFRQSRRTVESFLAKRAKNPLYRGDTSDPIRAGFFVNWDPASYTSLAQHINGLNAVFVEWSRILPNRSDSLIFEADSNAIRLLAQHPDVNVHCMVSNYDETTQSWRGDLLAAKLENASSRHKLVRSIVALARDNHFYGINIDFEDVPASVQPSLLVFLDELHKTLHTTGQALSFDAPADDNNFDLRAYANVTDYVSLMAYDEHSSESSPGPISSIDWFMSVVDNALKVVPKNKLIVDLAAYGYDWATDPNGRTHMGDEISFGQAVVTAKESDTTLAFDTTSACVHFGYDEDQEHHDVWLNDAVSVYDELAVLYDYNIAGVAIWRLGAEDPSMWHIFAPHVDIFSESRLRALDTLSPATEPEYQGEGELLNLIAEPSKGERTIDYDSNEAYIKNERFTTLPSGYELRRYGKDPHKVVLTFDDGPDPIWTPKILDVLAEKHAPAVFFVVGVNAERNFPLLERIYREGHEIGNHTFTHPNIALISPSRTITELSLTENIIKAATYRKSVLFRPPYNADAEPATFEELEPVARAARLGYVMVGESDDPQDWNTPKTAADIVDTALAQLSLGSIILLHDAGGDRSATLAALPILIDSIRARGLEISSLSNFTGIAPNVFMQSLAGRELQQAETDAVLLRLVYYAQLLLYAIFYVAIIASIVRLLFIAVLAIVQWRMERQERAAMVVIDRPPVSISVLIPAYNEGIVVRRTLETVLASRYPNFDVTVIDDGSTDDTYRIAKESFTDDPRVRVLTKANGGKASALNFGIARTTGEIVVVIDADTVFDPEALNELSYYFEREADVGAVAGNVKVGNRINVLTKWQGIEYITSQNFDRRAFELLGAITVVPGAIGAFRRAALEEVGLYTSDTLAEDTDLTMRVVRAGWKIRYAERAIAWTEAPEKIEPFMKQRFRWTFGVIQSFWKHRDALFNIRTRGLGMIAMPNILFFQILLPLLAPVVDLIFVVSLFSGHTDVTIVSYLLFVAIDLVGSIIAFSFEGERLTLLAWLPLQRFLYRQIMYYVLFRSIVAALRGRLQGWGKLQRTGSVHATAKA